MRSQGVLALKNSFNGVGLDHVLLVRIASTAVVTRMLGGNREQVINAVSNAWIDGRRAEDLSTCAQYGVEKKLGRGRCDQPGGAPCPHLTDR